MVSRSGSPSSGHTVRSVPARADVTGARRPGPLLVLDGSYPSVGGGGAESQVGTLGRWFNANGYNCTLVTPMSADSSRLADEVMDGLPVRRLRYPRVPLLGSLILQCRLALTIWQERDRISAVHAHIGKWMAVTSCLMGRLLGVPVYVKMTGATELKGGVLDPAAGLSARLQRRGLALATGYQAISGEIARAIEAVGLPRERIVMIANAVDLTRFGLRHRDGNGGANPRTSVERAMHHLVDSPSPFDVTAPADSKPGAPLLSTRALMRGPVGRALRERVCPGAEFVVLFSGRLERVKRLDLLLQAWGDTLAHDKKAWLLLAGEGAERERLQAQAQASGIADRVLFLGHVGRIIDYIHASDVLALVSDNEGLSNSMLEGMAGGLPVLGSRISGTEDFITEGATGWLFEPGNLGALSRQLAAARATPPAELARMSRAAHDEIVARASVQAVTSALLAVYRQPKRKR